MLSLFFLSTLLWHSEAVVAPPPWLIVRAEAWDTSAHADELVRKLVALQPGQGTPVEGVTVVDGKRARFAFSDSVWERDRVVRAIAALKSFEDRRKKYPTLVVDGTAGGAFLTASFRSSGWMPARGSIVAANVEWSIGLSFGQRMVAVKCSQPIETGSQGSDPVVSSSPASQNLNWKPPIA